MLVCVCVCVCVSDGVHVRVRVRLQESVSVRVHVHAVPKLELIDFDIYLHDTNSASQEYVNRSDNIMPNGGAGPRHIIPQWQLMPTSSWGGAG